MGKRRRSIVPWLAAGTVLALAGGGGSGGPDVPTVSSAGRAAFQALVGLAPGLDVTQRRFFELVAYGEANFSSKAHNDSASEVDASRKAYERNKAIFAKCGIPSSRYIIGSGGFGGLLPANAVYNVRKTFPCWPPESIFAPAPSIVMMVAFARNLQERPDFKSNRTVGNLRVGWGIPGNMGTSPPATKLEKFRAQAEKLGLGRAFIDTPIAVFPGDYAAIYQALLSQEPTPDDVEPPNVEIEGPFPTMTQSAGGVLPDEYADRRFTTDEGFTTLDWWRYRGRWIRVDVRLHSDGGLRWVVFGSPAHVLALALVEKTVVSSVAANKAANWIDVAFPGGG